ncbi:unnamed protein product [Caenorhabditis auriculariae]|uniref:Uncharacterized protein n=1 Tax=Caenorhabditis auriculariae TaxID=2777116 RepID=A0A8S1HK20_9PELO|nr:unnamed protein product [Caenorhabditis auriculariae]
MASETPQSPPTTPPPQFHISADVDTEFVNFASDVPGEPFRPMRPGINNRPRDIREAEIFNQEVCSKRTFNEVNYEQYELHEKRMQSLREALEDVRKIQWLHVVKKK